MATGTKAALDTDVLAFKVLVAAGDYDGAAAQLIACEVTFATLPDLEKISFHGTLELCNRMLEAIRKRSAGWKVIRHSRRR